MATEATKDVAAESAPAAKTASLSDAVAAKVVKQMNFWFGDFNLPRDKFLREKVAADADGWVDLSILMSFARMKKLTSNAAGVAEAVRKSSSVVEVAEDGKRVRRKSPLPASTNFIDSSVYAKGFPKTGTSLDEVETAFAKFGDVGRVTFRKFKDGNFKGSVFVEFKTKAAADACLAAGSDIKFRGKPLLKVSSKAAYLKEKSAEHEERLARKNKGKGKGAAAADGAAAESGATFFDVTIVEGGLLRLKGIGAGVDSYTVRDTLRQHANVKYVDMEGPATTAIVRLESKEDADKIIKALDDGLQLGADAKITTETIQGEEAANYWSKVQAHHRRQFDVRQQRNRAKAAKQARKEKAASRKRARDEDSEGANGSGAATGAGGGAGASSDSAGASAATASASSPSTEPSVKAQRLSKAATAPEAAPERTA